MGGRADARVREWLQDLLHPGSAQPQDQIPELGEETVAELSKAMDASLEEDRLARWQAQEADARAASYKAEAEAEILAKCGLGIAGMPPEAAAPLDTLAECAALLGCPDTAAASLLAALCDTDDAVHAAAREGRAHKAALGSMRRQRAEAEGELEALRVTERALEEACEAARAEDAGRGRRVQHLTAKAAQYQSMLAELKEELRSCNVSSSIYHSSLTKDSHKAQEVHAEIRQLQARLAHFEGLPPDLRLAKQRVGETLQDLDEVERALQDSIRNMVVGS